MKFVLSFILFLLFYNSVRSQDVSGKIFVENFYSFFVNNYKVKKSRDSIIKICFSTELLDKFNKLKNDSLVNNYIFYTFYTKIEEIKSIEISPYKNKKRLNIYSIIFNYNNSFLYAKVKIIRDKKNWLIDAIGNLEFL